VGCALTGRHAINRFKWRTTMTKSFPKLLTAVAAAAFLSISPVSAQTVGGPEISRDQLIERVQPVHRENMLEAWRGLTMPPASEVAFDPTPGAAVPATVQLSPVPDEIIAVSPDVTGYHYYTRADGSIILVDPVTREVAMVLN
jgi:hypothetical protein